MSKSFAEVAMELSGKTAQESESIGKVDTADDQVEGLFQEKAIQVLRGLQLWETKQS